MIGRRWITTWDPNDSGFWDSEGRRIAARNLAFSIFAEFLGFSVWQLWSTISTQVNKGGFHLTVSQLFWLVAIPSLVGATMRFPYGALVPIVGGRNWTIVSATLLLIPTTLLGVLMLHPGAPYWMLVVAAAAAGLGGGNFASSMANISYFYPDSRKGLALGLNAAGGNIGVAFVQFVVPAALGLGVLGLGATKASHPALQWAGFLWLPLIVAAALCAYFLMDNLAVSRASIREQAVVLRRPDTWVMSWLYIGTFGSFIGYSAAFPLLIKLSFPHMNPLQFAFLGPLVGSLARPAGGWLSDRLGGSVVTFWNFVAMLAATLGVIAVLGAKAQPWGFAAFLGVFLLLFVTTGVGNGSTFRMIPAIFRAAAQADPERNGKKEAAAVLAFSSAVGAYGGFLIPQGYNLAYARTHGPSAALAGFAIFYLTCIVITWAVYLRSTRTAPAAAGALAEARV